MFEKYLFDHKVFSPFFLDVIERRKKTSFSFVLVVYFQSVSFLFTKIMQQGILPEIPGNNTEIINYMLNFVLKKDTL